ncbi:bifunctional diguanylate cyclase/phosphodiesterase [Arabiibacter massiliensis]|uniref:bifunctional diguanylate cyclase/phosphodiesterase n=1 Tax=Arabiibacter massiliensis TaxID=1870985 RepID=UPI00117BDEC5|nr:EAL domain-containing protein [Arabiibacter massiliensis]
MLEYLDNLSEIVYVADLETHELLYLNEAGKRHYGVDDVRGRKCYEALQGEEAPCPYCTNERLSFDEPYTWEYASPSSKRRYLVKDLIIDWHGRPARLEVALDSVPTDVRGDALENALQAEGSALRCVRELYRARDAQDAATLLLDQVGAFMEADRAFLYDSSAEDCVVREWTAPGKEPLYGGLDEEVLQELLQRWTRHFADSEGVVVSDVRTLRGRHPDAYADFVRRGVRSVAVAPLEHEGGVVGFLGVENAPTAKLRSAASLLNTLGYFFLMTEQRIATERKLTRLSFHDSLTGLCNRNRYMADVERLEKQGGAPSLGAVFLDLNDLKDVNDLYGHDCGDELLRESAGAMKRALVGFDVYRIGGDEFVALAPGMSRERFDELVGRLEEALGGEDGRWQRHVSLGAQWAPECADVNALLQAADAQMYEQKRSFHREKAFAGLTPAEPDVSRSSGPIALDSGSLLREYNMLMSALRVSVSKHLMTERFEVVWANDFYYQLTGYTRQEYEGLFNNNVADYFADYPDEFSDLARIVMEAVAAGEPGYECLLHMPVKGGNRMWIRVVGLFTNEQVDGIPVIYATFTGVDDVVQMQRERSMTFENLPGFVARYRVTPGGIKLMWGNHRFEEFFGTIGEDVTQRLFEENLAYNAEAIGARYEAFRQGLPATFEVEAKSCTGRKAFFTVVAECIDWKDGDPVYLVLYLDTTEVVEQRHRAEVANERLRTLAFVDPVTGGRNRTSFDMDATAAVQAAPPGAFALVAVDIEKFKVINDQFGLEQGDAVLGLVNECFASHLGKGELVGRISADVFNLLMRNDEPRALASRIERMAVDANKRLAIDGVPTYVLTFTAGVYAVDDPALPMMRIQDRANVARKKKDGSSRGERLCVCRFYSNEDRVRLSTEKDIENRMRDALAAGEFEVHLQPKLDVRANAVAGAEALVRWRDPVRGLVMPGDFIPLFERNGFVVELDLHIFEQVCALLRAWIRAGERPVPVSVNLSRRHLTDLRFLEAFERIRARFDVPASLLEFEITETLVFEDPELLSSVIDAIHRAGYRCSMDDFGSGYSSLNVLKNLEVDVLKLDRAFFGDPNCDEARGAAIIDAVIAMARQLGMDTVAEGVETEAQLGFLAKAGCDYIQGYLFSRPVDAAAFERLVFGAEVPGGARELGCVGGACRLDRKQAGSAGRGGESG